MDHGDLIDLFSQFGPISLRRMFSGYGIAADGVNFAMSLRTGIILRVDEQTVGRFEAEGAGPFRYQTRNRTVIVNSYRHLPERLYDDPDELAVWAREAVGAAHRAKARKSSKPGRSKAAAAKSAKPAAGIGRARRGSAATKRGGSSRKGHARQET